MWCLDGGRCRSREYKRTRRLASTIVVPGAELEANQRSLAEHVELTALGVLGIHGPGGDGSIPPPGSCCARLINEMKDWRPLRAASVKAAAARGPAVRLRASMKPTRRGAVSTPCPGPLHGPPRNC